MARAGAPGLRARVGAVAYDPKVVTIWEGFTQVLARAGHAGRDGRDERDGRSEIDLSYVLFPTYEAQVEAQLDGLVDLAWNSPLAFVATARACARLGRGRPRALVMRDADQDVSSVIVARADRSVARLEDLRGRTVAVGAADSPQAMLVPLEHLAAAAGLEPGRDFEVLRHDTAGAAGKHGDVLAGERQAVRALLGGRADAACALDANLDVFTREGTSWPGALRVVARTPPYDHCNLTALAETPPELAEAVARALLALSYDDPAVRPIFELEGLKRWVPGRETGYAVLARAADRFGTLDALLAEICAGRA